MGQDKGLALLAGKPLIEHVLAVVSDLGDDLLITTNNPAGYSYLGIRLAADEHPGAGALPGLLTALQAARGDHVLLVACDMPFLNRTLLLRLLALAPKADVIAPRWEGRFQTMHTVYAREACLEAVEWAVEAGEQRMISFYPLVRVHEVPEVEVARLDAEGRSFMNINTPGELASAEARIRAQLAARPDSPLEPQDRSVA